MSAWLETVARTGTNIDAYLSFYSVYLPDRVRVEAKRPLVGEPYEIHPWNYALATMVFLAASLGLGMAFLLMMAVKLLPILARAIINHAREAGSWFWGGHLHMIALYFLYYLAVPVAAALALPAALLYGVYVAGRVGGAIVASRGALFPGWLVAREALVEANRGTTRYILNQNVPFLVLPSANPIHLQWLLAALLPFLIGLVVDAIAMAIITCLMLVPCLVCVRRRPCIRRRPSLHA